MTQHPRERVTIDLRGIGPRLHAHAAARGKTAAAAVRAALVAVLDADVESEAAGSVAESTDGRLLRVTVRMGALHAARLADRARSADVSQGTYVAGLLDGTPPAPRSVDHGDAVAALADSTLKIAAMSSDIHGFIRLMRRADSAGAEKYRAGLMSLSKDVRLHLEVASRLLVGLTSHRRTSRSAVTLRSRGGVSQ